MAEHFQNFSEAGLLYAKYIGVVEEMSELFKRDISNFHDALRTAMEGELGPGRLKEEFSSSNQYRSWWLEDGDAIPDYAPYIWMKTRDPTAIIPGELRLHISSEGGDAALRSKIDSFRQTVTLPPHCEWTKVGKFVAAVIKYGDSPPVAACVAPTLTVLRAMDELVR